jgi:hypothetical protein
MLIEYTQEAGAGKVNFVQDLAKRHLFIGETKTSRNRWPDWDDCLMKRLSI